MSVTLQNFDFTYEVNEFIKYEEIKSHPKLNKFIALAKKVTALSDHKRFPLGAVITVKGVKVAEGFNQYKSHPLQKFFNQYRTNLLGSKGVLDAVPNHLHAELDAMLKAIRAGVDLSKAEITVSHIGSNGQFKMARPCPACMQAIKFFKVPVVNYFTEDGFATEYMTEEKSINVKNSTKLI